MPRKPPQSDLRNLITELFSEEGVNVVNGVLEQLIHFSHGFVTQLRGNAQDLTLSSEAVTVEHIHLANELRSFPQSRLQQQDIHRAAARVNTKPFPKIEPHQGLSLPNEEYCLLANNFQYGKLDNEIPAENESGSKKRKGESEGMQPQSSTWKKRSIEQYDLSDLEAAITKELEANRAAEEQHQTEVDNNSKEPRKEEKQHISSSVDVPNNSNEAENEDKKSKTSKGSKLKYIGQKKNASDRLALQLDEAKFPLDRTKSGDVN